MHEETQRLIVAALVERVMALEAWRETMEREITAPAQREGDGTEPQ